MMTTAAMPSAPSTLSLTLPIIIFIIISVSANLTINKMQKKTTTIFFVKKLNNRLSLAGSFRVERCCRLKTSTLMIWHYFFALFCLSLQFHLIVDYWPVRLKLWCSSIRSSNMAAEKSLFCCHKTLWDLKPVLMIFFNLN